MDWLTDWVDPGAIRTLVDSVRDAFDTAPLWARAGLLVMLALAVVVGILRIVGSVIGRLVVLAVIVMVAVGLSLWGPEILQRVAG